MLIPEVTYFDDEMKDRLRILECTSCKNLVEHQVKHSYMVCSEITGADRSWDNNSLFEIIQCLSCHLLSFRREDYFSEEGTTVHLFPTREPTRIEAKNFLTLPTHLREIYGETIEAVNVNLLYLASSGLSALLVGVCAELGIDGDLSTGLMKKSLLRPADAQRVSEMNLMKHFSRISKLELRRRLKIVEQIVEASFDLGLN